MKIALVEALTTRNTLHDGWCETWIDAEHRWLLLYPNTDMAVAHTLLNLDHVVEIRIKERKEVEDREE